MRRLLGLVMAGLLLLSAAPAALAAPPVSVDPSTLTPPANPSFDWTCLRLRHGIECLGSQVAEGVDVNPAPEFACDGNPILVTFEQTLIVRRSHDSAGRVTHSHTVGWFDETWRLAGSNRTLISTGRWTVSIDLAVPGDITSRTVTYRGNTLTVRDPGQGVVIRNVGLVKLNWDESVVLEVRGRQDMLTDFDAAIGRACAAFGA